jgi:PAS domain S-box-containing protein
MSIIPNETEDVGMDYAILLVEEVSNRLQWVDDIQSLFGLASDILCIVDLEGVTIRMANPAFSSVSGYDEDELVCRRLTDLTHPNDISRVTHFIREISDRGQNDGNLLTRLVTKGGKIKWINWYVGCSENKRSLYFVGSDVTEKRMAEQELKRRQMEYMLEDGHVYLVNETGYQMSHRAFVDLVDIGYDGVVFHRTATSDLEEMPEDRVRLYWLANNKEESCLDPDIQRLREVMMDLPTRQAILIERLDYIISHNGFRETLSFIHYLRELTYINDSIMIITIDPGTVNKRQLRLLEKECLELQPVHTSLLEDDLFDVLRVIHKHDLMKIGTTYRDLTGALDISKPTARKRVNSLRYYGYIVEVKRGKRKAFTLTEKGWNLMSR